MSEATQRDLEKIDLQPCPFCASGGTIRKTNIAESDIPPAWMYWVQCGNRECGAGPMMREWTEEQAVEKWNTRALTTATADLERQLAEAKRESQSRGDVLYTYQEQTRDANARASRLEADLAAARKQNEELNARIKRVFDAKLREYNRRLALRAALGGVLTLLEEIDTAKVVAVDPIAASAISKARVAIDQAFETDSVPFAQHGMPDASDGGSQEIGGTTGDATALTPTI